MMRTLTVRLEHLASARNHQRCLLASKVLLEAHLVHLFCHIYLLSPIFTSLICDLIKLLFIFIDILVCLLKRQSIWFNLNQQLKYCWFLIYQLINKFKMYLNLYLFDHIFYPPHLITSSCVVQSAHSGLEESAECCRVTS